MVNRIFNIINFIYSLYFNFRYLPFKQAVNLPIWITTNFRVHGLKRGQLILCKPIHRSVMFGCWGSLGLQQMKGKLIFSKNSHLILLGHTVISQGSVLKMDNGAFIELGNDFYCNKNCYFRASRNLFFGNDCQVGWNVQINTSDGHAIFHDGKSQVSDLPINVGNHVWITSNTIITKGVSIADGCIIAQGAVVTKSINEPRALVGGGNSKSDFAEYRMEKIA